MLRHEIRLLLLLVSVSLSQFISLFWGMAAMPFPLWSSHNTVDDSLASFTFTNKFGLLYMEVSLLSFSTHLAIPYV